MNFSSENHDAAHHCIMDALVKANKGFEPSYGSDAYTLEAIDMFKRLFGDPELSAFFCFNGTGANNFAISAVTDKYNSVFCSDISHLYTAESTAPEAFTGCRLYPVRSIHGKIVLEDLLLQVAKKNDVHLPVPAILTITQPTEYGTVYTLKELQEIAARCRENNILLHIDGARIFNALAALNCTFKELVSAARADVLTLGGTKLGLLFGEAVIFFNSGRFKNIHYNHKRSMQLASKNRFIAAQFIALLQDGLWKSLAKYTNELAAYFAKEVSLLDKDALTCAVETNAVFLRMKPSVFNKLKQVARFYMWDVSKEEARCIFSFNNTREEIDLFVSHYKKAIAIPANI